MRELIRTSIVFRSASAVLGMALLVGSIFSLFTYFYLASTEQKHAISNIKELLNSVENTVAVACYLSDTNLSNDVANDLQKNTNIKEVRIFNNKTLLSEVKKDLPNASNNLSRAISKDSDFIQTDIYSPFNKTEQVCHIRVRVNQEAIYDQSTTKARIISAFLFLQTILMASAVAYIVLSIITRPIKTISDRLHNLRPEKGELLPQPEKNKYDELGQLTSDVNRLIADLVGTLEEERELRIQHALGEKKFQTIFDNAETGIFQMNKDAILTSCNPAFLQMLGVEKENSSNALIETMKGQELRLHLMIDTAINEMRVLSDDFYVEVDHRKQKKWIHLVIHATENGELQGLMNDITERKLREENANQLAITDHLTGAYNRLGFEREMARRSKAHINESGSPFFIMLIDLDKFKQVNDQLGHQAGDEVLIQFSNILHKTLRKSDFIARVGGDEFIVLLHDLQKQTIAEEIAKKIISQVAAPIALSAGSWASIGTSIGITFVDRASFVPAEVLAKADIAMYEVKKSGRNDYRMADTTDS
ncbi:sensor domain-containing diguanylate cyclase [Undibacterium jejuense]|uniref:Sensor domain-containing diguanylate cyclase n=2 Tax=Undibacterium jejuense TaxID=1344949 RepID=A0A923KN97_9BURK|nr:sensor domain-containing diguanylate cyclase [Undibacterium jejuense]MBC3861628.1 sensor domain-containing diguanylate cyclase [Undibacterium jejuense]